MKIFFKVMITIATLLFSFNVFSWNALGHMVIANIAYERLKPDVRKKVDKMTHDLGTEYAEVSQFNQLAPWPDTIRAQKIEMYTRWHYIDLPFSDDGTPLKNIVDTDNVVWAINKLSPVVGNAKANPYERARSLAFLLHLVGDIHQPLHTVGRISAALPDGDQGGNLYFVRFPNAANQKMTLHKLWDQGIDIFTINNTPEAVDLLSNSITAHFPVEYFGAKVNDLMPENWSQEGLSLSSSFVYSTPENQVPSPTYVQKGKDIVEQQIALSGYRLANLLNKLLA